MASLATENPELFHSGNGQIELPSDDEIDSMPVTALREHHVRPADGNRLRREARASRACNARGREVTRGTPSSDGRSFPGSCIHIRTDPRTKRIASVE